MNRAPIFLTYDDVSYFHDEQIRIFGGKPGVRDEGVICSAIAEPFATFDGAFLHEDLFAMAKAYAYHLCKNHGFIDGNKRVALHAALAFLELNGVTLLNSPKNLFTPAMVGAAAGEVDKEALGGLFQQCRQLEKIIEGG